MREVVEGLGSSERINKQARGKESMAFSRAQAAMEYLMTYGWALLALFLVVAFLLSSGAFSFSSFSQQECTFQPDLPCSSYILYLSSPSSTALSFTLSNGLGFPIKLANVTYTAAGLGSSSRQTYTGTVDTSRIYKPGERMAFNYTFTGSPQPAQRDFKTIIVTLTYTNCRQGTPCTSNYTTSGRISAVVEKK